MADQPAVSFQPPVPTDPTFGPGLIDSARVCELLGIKSRKLWELTNSGAIRVVRIGRRVLYDPADLRAFVDAQKSEAR
jgi:excisionase family DNA binding protein